MSERIRRSWDRDRIFLRVIPEILIYQVITKIMLFVIVMVLKHYALLALYHAGRSVFTSSDLPYLFKTKGGWVLPLSKTRPSMILPTALRSTPLSWTVWQQKTPFPP